MNKNIFEIVEEVLKTNSKYISDDGKLLKAMVYSDVITMDKELLCLLLSNEKIKERFFKDVNGTLIFDKQGFAWFIESKEFLPDSYTRYTNKIGLTNGGDFISKSNDVVLDFPYKDCVLEGGQDTEDQKRKEIFYNEIIASDEISKMLAPKVFTNAKRYTKDGVEENITFDQDDNLIIKGNNLIVLWNLLKRYQGKVKCIYIDPPYNTRSDANTFAYNNTFNHSTWLTFMKNRLEIAKKLLSEDGIIFIDIDHYELFYLGVLADEIFGYSNRLGILAVVHNLKGRYSEFFSVAHENKLVYAKNAENATIKEFTWDNSSEYPFEDTISKYKLAGLQRTGNGSLREERPNLFYPIYFNPKTNEIDVVEHAGFITILPIDSEGVERRWRWGKDWKTELVIKKVKDEYKINTKIRIKGKRPKTLWNRPEYSGTSGTNELKSLVGDGVFSYPKAVPLVMDSLEIATDEDSIVIDFFGGSGTSGQAVLDLNKKDNGNRKFILIEQMNYIEKATVGRIRSVINKNNDGSFVYCELLENASTLIKKIQAASEETISEIKNEIYADERIIPYITREELKKADEEFASLELEEKKKALISLVDKNKLYVNYSDIDDESYAISESDKAFTKSFYAEV